MNAMTLLPTGTVTFLFTDIDQFRRKRLFSRDEVNRPYLLVCQLLSSIQRWGILFSWPGQPIVPREL
jgi:hypothetical protein